jgi:hypothetical protein
MAAAENIYFGEIAIMPSIRSAVVERKFWLPFGGLKRRRYATPTASSRKRDDPIWLSNFDTCGTERPLNYQSYLDILRIVRDRYRLPLINSYM